MKNLTIKEIRERINVDSRIIWRASVEYGVKACVLNNKICYEPGIIDAVKKYLGALKRKPLSLDYKTWESCKK